MSFLYLRPRSGRRYYILLLKFLSFSFFSFHAGSLRWRYRQGTFIAQMVGYRCNFKNLVQNLGGGRPPIKIWGPQTSQCWKPKSEDEVQTYSGNRPWERVSKTGFKILGAPPKKIWGGSKFKKFDIETRLAQHGSHSLQIFTSGSGSWCLTYVPLGGRPSPQKNLGGGEIFSQPLRVRGRGPKFFWQ